MKDERSQILRREKKLKIWSFLDERKSCSGLKKIECLKYFSCRKCRIVECCNASIAVNSEYFKFVYSFNFYNYDF